MTAVMNCDSLNLTKSGCSRGGTCSFRRHGSADSRGLERVLRSSKSILSRNSVLYDLCCCTGVRARIRISSVRNAIRQTLDR